MPEVNGRDVVGSSTRSYHLEGTRECYNLMEMVGLTCEYFSRRKLSLKSACQPARNSRRDLPRAHEDCCPSAFNYRLPRRLGTVQTASPCVVRPAVPWLYFSQCFPQNLPKRRHSQERGRV
ncbi:Gamma-Aminobutyric Acid Receptor Subunit Gamma-3 [Manis pentadactyla]|nr:Gamma-Aminobutyric Acid Receptor Subunit Gamma-3 [Manis pentadactyla]